MLDKEASRSLDELEIGALNDAEARATLDIVARDLRDNPLNVAAFGEDPERRLNRMLHTATTPRKDKGDAQAYNL
jgi:hypothetical protein